MSTPESPFAIEHAIIFTGDDFIEDGYVVIEHGRINAIGSGECPDRRPMTRLSRPGYTVVPGLIDAHIHCLFGNTNAIEQSLRFGVTTVCDMHNERAHLHKLQSLSASDKSRYAELKCAGVSATIRGGWPTPVVLSHGATPQARATVDSWPRLESPADAEPYVRRQIDECGASYIKLMHEVGDVLGKSLPTPSVALQQALVTAAHAHGLIAVGHAFSHAGAHALLEAGVDGLTHVFVDEAPADSDWIALCQRHGTHVNPTLTTCGSQTNENDDLQTAFADDPLAQQMLIDAGPRQALAMAVRPGNSLANAYASTRALYQAGVPLIVGSDASGQSRGTSYGLGVHMEMWQMRHRIGMSPRDVLRAATTVPAERFGFTDRGKLEVGRHADLVLIEGDVRRLWEDETIKCLPVRRVWREGWLASVFLT